MRTRLVWSLLVSMACIFSATNLAAKAEAVDNGSYTSKDKEFYLSTEQLEFIRPGLEIELISVVLPADMQLEVTYSITDPGGMPLDAAGITTPGEVDVRFVLANIPAGQGQKVRIAYERDSRDGTLTSLGDGVYMFKFDTVLASDLDTTHTLVLGARRDLRDYNLDRYAANDLQNWVPSGMYDPVPRDIVAEETCDRCHGELAFHGSRWLTVAACDQCHNPATIEDYPFDTVIHGLHMGGNLETPLIIGRHDYTHLEYPADMQDCEVCHTGGTPTENFPLVASPNPVLVCDKSGKGTTTLSWGDLDSFEIRMGTDTGKLVAKGKGAGSKEIAKWVQDETVFVLVDKASGNTLQELRVDATVLGCVSNAPGTFRGVASAQHTNWLDNPSRRVCGSCHDGVDFATGEGHSEFEIAQPDDSACHFCHTPESTDQEFGLSVRGAHKLMYKSAQLPGLLVKIIKIEDTDPGDTPTVTFTVFAKKGAINPNTLNRLPFVITGPNTDFDVYINEDVKGKAKRGAGGTWTYTFEAPIPLDAVGSFTVSVEGRTDPVDVNHGGDIVGTREFLENPMMAFAVTDASATPRRVIVDDAKCENCHSNLSLHGDNRKNAQYCTTCHRPDLTDEAVRLEGEDESVHFKYMVHRIHRGAGAAEEARDYIVYGYRNSLHDYSEVEYPGDLRDCDACHVNDSQQLPLPADLLPTMTPADWWSPTAPAAAACLSCHVSDEAAAHADSNTAIFGESCSVCHGEGKDAAVDKVHAR